MSLDNFFDHKCDIYHLRKSENSPGYGLSASPCFSYYKEPDIKEQICHFGIKSQNVTITQNSPANVMEAKIKLTLPYETDIRLNDKIIDCSNGFEYTAEEPHCIRSHHIFVYVKKTKEQKPL